MYRELAQQQDNHLEQLNEMVNKTNQGQRGLENQLVLDRQILNDFHNEIDYTTERMNTVQKKLANLLQTSGKGISIFRHWADLFGWDNAGVHGLHVAHDYYIMKSLILRYFGYECIPMKIETYSNE